MAEFDLSDVLKECRASAQIGYNIASSQYRCFHDTIVKAEEKIKSTLLAFNASNYDLSDATEALSQQLTNTRSDLDRMSFAFRDDLQLQKENLGKFSITLFGRTMAGKSTLMEILTQGDGSSIGHGAQRTTQDVREYYWNGLKITDVPGISAFEGEEDESVAFEAAKAADLILFLITDDAPQASEAECFGQILDLGKPVIGIINVKAAVAEGKSVKLALRDIEKKFDENRLAEIRNHFYAYAEKRGQNWRNIPFVHVHLKSAYMAQHVTDEATGESYLRASRIGNLKNEIVQRVRTKGKFYRTKTLVDTISVPMLYSMENLLQQSLVNRAQGRIILAKKSKLETWKKEFERMIETQIAACIAQIQSELDAETAAFAEEHFEDQDPDKAWQKLLKERAIQNRCQELLEDLEDQCIVMIREISREISNELDYEISSSKNIHYRGGRIIDGKKVWGWSTKIIGGGLTIGWMVAGTLGTSAAGPLGWAAAGVGVIGAIGASLFKSRDKKEQEKRIRLERALRQNISSTCRSCENQMKKKAALLVKTHLDRIIQGLDHIDSVLLQLADTQKELAWYLDENLLALNISLVKEALRLVGAEGLEYHMKEVARIPGTAMTFMLNKGVVFPDEQKEQLEDLTGESIRLIYDSQSKRTLISNVIGEDIAPYNITVDDKKGIAHIPADDFAPQTENRVRMAQQFSRMIITNYL